MINENLKFRTDADIASLKVYLSEKEFLRIPVSEDGEINVEVTTEGRYLERFGYLKRIKIIGNFKVMAYDCSNSYMDEGHFVKSKKCQVYQKLNNVIFVLKK